MPRGPPGWSRPGRAVDRGRGRGHRPSAARSMGWVSRSAISLRSAACASRASPPGRTMLGRWAPTAASSTTRGSPPSSRGFDPSASADREPVSQGTPQQGKRYLTRHEVAGWGGQAGQPKVLGGLAADDKRRQRLAQIGAGGDLDRRDPDVAGRPWDVGDARVTWPSGTRLVPKTTTAPPANAAVGYSPPMATSNSWSPRASVQVTL